MTVLKPRHEAFCQQFTMDPNAVRAAMVAGYASRTARQQGYRLLKMPAVAERIGDLRADIAKRHCLGADVPLGKREAVYRRAMEGHIFMAPAVPSNCRRAWPG